MSTESKLLCRAEWTHRTGHGPGDHYGWHVIMSNGEIINIGDGIEAEKQAKLIVEKFVECDKLKIQLRNSSNEIDSVRLERRKTELECDELRSERDRLKEENEKLKENCKSYLQRTETYIQLNSIADHKIHELQKKLATKEAREITNKLCTEKNEKLQSLNKELVETLIYARSFMRNEDADGTYIDTIIQKAKEL